MYSTKDNIELSRIDIYELSNLIGYMNYKIIDDKQLNIDMPVFIDENQVINVSLQNEFMKAIKEKQASFIKSYAKSNSQIDVSFELMVNMGDGTPVKKIIV